MNRGVDMNLKHRVQNFWKYFETVQSTVEQALQEGDQHELEHLLEDLNHRLATIVGTKMELEMNENGFFEMTFPSGGDKNVQFCSAILVKDAPEQLKENWILNPWRPPLSQKAMNSYIDVKGKRYGGADFKIYYKINEALKMLDIEVYCEALKDMEEDYRNRLVAYMLELFIGELELEARINSITIIDTPSDEENVCLLPNFYEDICDIIIDEEWSEYHDPTTIYMAYKLDEKLPSETLRKDMKMIITTNPLLQEELLNQEYQSCKDMKERGAEYGYLFYEVLYEDEKEALLRQQLEKEINKLFYDMSLARTIGGAIGIHYSYIDVAVFDIDGFKIALEKLNEKLSFKIYYRSFLEN